MAADLCVQCGRQIAGASKLANLDLPIVEAEVHSWLYSKNPEGTATVKMCLQCQITRAERQRRPPA